MPLISLCGLELQLSQRHWLAIFYVPEAEDAAVKKSWKELWEERDNLEYLLCLSLLMVFGAS